MLGVLQGVKTVTEHHKQQTTNSEDRRLKACHIKSRIWWVYISLKWMNQLLKTVLSVLMSVIQAVGTSVHHTAWVFSIT